MIHELKLSISDLQGDFTKDIIDIIGEMKVDLPQMDAIGLQLDTLMADSVVKMSDADDAETAEPSDQDIDSRESYELVFENEDEQEIFFRFIDMIKQKFPDEETIADKIDQWISEEGL